MDAVVGVDLDTRWVRFSSGQSTHYDFLVLATGARYQSLGHPDWQQHVLTLKSLEDALRLRERVFSALELAELVDRADTEQRRRAYLSFVIVGAGPTGAEMAGAMGRLLPDILKHRFPHLDRSQLRIVLIDPQPHALPAMHKNLGEYADGQLKYLR